MNSTPRRSREEATPLNAWIFATDGSAVDGIDRDQRFKKLSRSILVEMMQKQEELGLSHAQFASAIGLKLDNYNSYRQTILLTLRGVNMHARTLADIVHAEVLDQRLRDKAIVQLLHKLLGGSSPLTEQKAEQSILNAAFGKRAMQLLASPELPEWVQQIDDETMEFWSVEPRERAKAKHAAARPWGLRPPVLRKRANESDF